jgi:hypothetical protein
MNLLWLVASLPALLSFAPLPKRAASRVFQRGKTTCRRHGKSLQAKGTGRVGAKGQRGENASRIKSMAQVQPFGDAWPRKATTMQPQGAANNNARAGQGQASPSTPAHLTCETSCCDNEFERKNQAGEEWEERVQPLCDGDKEAPVGNMPQLGTPASLSGQQRLEC